jgi:hypothetical protein
MTFTSNGFTLCKPYTNVKMLINNILQRCNKKWRRMWKDVWVSCNFIFASFKTCLDYGKWIWFMKSWLLVIHNMIFEDERDQNFEPLFDQTNVGKIRCRLNFQTYMEGIQEIENFQTHFNLILDLVDTCGPWRACTNLIQKNFLLKSHILQ